MNDLTLPQMPRLIAAAVAIEAKLREHPRLGHAVGFYANPDTAGMPPLDVSRETAMQAAALADAGRLALAPASDREWRAFLRPLAGVCRFVPPPGRDFDTACALLAGVLHTIPGSLLTVSRAMEAARRFAAWPTAADLAKWLDPEARHLRATVGALATAAGMAPPERIGDPLTHAERAAAIAASLARHPAPPPATPAPPPAAKPAKPLPLAPVDLASWRQNNALVRQARASEREMPDSGSGRMAPELGS